MSACRDGDLYAELRNASTGRMCPMFKSICLKDKCMMWHEYEDQFEEKHADCLIADYLKNRP